MKIISRKEMNAADFASELFGVIPIGQAKEIYRNIEHYTEAKKNIIIDLLRANPRKYIAALLKYDD
ncbi:MULTISPECIES: hypothetical protein [Bacillus]|uniref:hypothetical protein n=1 Tax=Bacillus TaxID=1386 RepID=UPI0009B7DAC4|nr:MULTISPECIES: hypothetical protein [Bacillus]ARC72552.1 hypothetical protein B37_00499 [Bacillus licheniformis]ARW41687.1 hypothetical protein S100141_00364 [Bacillus licheniformis]ARW56537.1 hypothetical protein S100027_04573 [Bacillus licheniformis]AXF87806.1 hypothetical protein BLDA23_05775 [Bacillus licheniformis]MCA1182449.1 hypothetical protein [Bacillus licheniformis]